ncbi:MAG: O-antigen ligase family protein [Planctomycetes bacterium]|nr:O-antigen ligase family protein [Planctomycetota bacterium]
MLERVHITSSIGVLPILARHPTIRCMSVIVRRLLIACVISTCAGSVLLYSGAGPMGPAMALGQDIGWNPILATAADWLTLPIPTADIADVRDVVLVAGLGLLLVLLCFSVKQRQAEAPKQRELPKEKAWRTPAPDVPFRWLMVTGTAVLLISSLSAAANQSWELSVGWLTRTAAGLAWAALLARTFDDRMVRQVLSGLLAAGAVCVLLSIAHRTDRHLIHFQWPIGPITPTATMAALWCAMATGGVVGLGWHRGHLGRSATLLAVAALSVYGLSETGRRGPALAVLGSALLLIACNRWQATRNRLTRGIIVLVVLAGMGGAGFYIAREALSVDRVASGSVGIRFEYWRLSWEMIRERLSLGSGPDTYVAEMTRAVAPLRGVSPHVYHGNMDVDAHNEWIQAAVEIGVPGALFWFMLPLGVVLLAWQPIPFESPLIQQGGGARLRLAPFGDPLRRSSALALTSGLLVIVVAECSGIMLRGPILPVWYWTLLGLLCALTRRRSPLAAEPTGTTAGGGRVARIGLVAGMSGAIVCAIVTYREISAASINAPQAIVENEASDQRLFSLRTIGLLDRAANYASLRAAAMPNPATRGGRRSMEKVVRHHAGLDRYGGALCGRVDRCWRS